MQKIILISLITVALVGCIDPAIKQPQFSIYRMQPDCSNASAQIRYLESQLDVPMYTVMPPSASEDRGYTGTVKELIWNIKQDCGVL